MSRSADSWLGAGLDDRVFRPKLGVACVLDIFVSPRLLTRGGPVGPGNVRQIAPRVRCAGTEKTMVMGGLGVSGCR